MTLNWSVYRVNNWETVCYWNNHKGERELHPITYIIISATNYLGINHITEKNYEDFHTRWMIYDSLFGATAMDEMLNGLIPSLSDIRKHIGLDTNTPTLTLYQFYDRVKKRILRRKEDERKLLNTQAPVKMQQYKLRVAVRCNTEVVILKELCDYYMITFEIPYKELRLLDNTNEYTGKVTKLLFLLYAKNEVYAKKKVDFLIREGMKIQIPVGKSNYSRCFCCKQLVTENHFIDQECEGKEIPKRYHCLNCYATFDKPVEILRENDGEELAMEVCPNCEGFHYEEEKKKQNGVEEP